MAKTWMQRGPVGPMGLMRQPAPGKPRRSSDRAPGRRDRRSQRRPGATTTTTNPYNGMTPAQQNEVGSLGGNYW